MCSKIFSGTKLIKLKWGLTSIDRRSLKCGVPREKFMIWEAASCQNFTSPCLWVWDCFVSYALILSQAWFLTFKLLLKLVYIFSVKWCTNAYLNKRPFLLYILELSVQVFLSSEKNSCKWRLLGNSQIMWSLGLWVKPRIRPEFGSNSVARRIRCSTIFQETVRAIYYLITRPLTSTLTSTFDIWPRTLTMAFIFKCMSKETVRAI